MKRAQNIFIKIIVVLSLIITAANTTVFAQQSQVNYKVTRILMDSTWDRNNESAVAEIIALFKPQMERIMGEAIGVTDYEMRSGRPESLLSNFAADALLEFGREYSKRKVDFSLTNFGGLRASLPKGEIRRFDLFSIFPFENYVVILELPGSSVKKLFETFAKNRVEAISGNVNLKIRGGELLMAQIDNNEIDMTKHYRVATIDFLMDGGDNLLPLKEALSVERTDVLLRDAMIEKIQKETALNRKITSSITGRIEIIKD